MKKKIMYIVIAVLAIAFGLFIMNEFKLENELKKYADYELVFEQDNYAFYEKGEKLVGLKNKKITELKSSTIEEIKKDEEFFIVYPFNEGYFLHYNNNVYFTKDLEKETDAYQLPITIDNIKLTYKSHELLLANNNRYLDVLGNKKSIQKERYLILLEPFESDFYKGIKLFDLQIVLKDYKDLKINEDNVTTEGQKLILTFDENEKISIQKVGN